MAGLFRIAITWLLVLGLTSQLSTAQEGEWSAVAEACIWNNNHWVGNVDSLGACQLSCEQQSDFTCLSVDYKDGRCQHSRYNRFSIRPTNNFTQPCYNGNTWLWSERLDIDYAWSDVVGGCIRGNNDRVLSGISTVETCQQRCIDEDSFVCLSIDYSPSSRGCHLSRFNSDSIRPTSDYTQPCYTGNDWKYSERRDKKYYWSDTVLGCIRNNNQYSGTVSSLADCQKRCVDETSYTCLSIDYKTSSRKCHLSKFNRDTLTPTSDFTQPCYVADWSYAERVDVGEWTPAVSACIRNNNIRSDVDVPDLASCLLICSQNDGCCSVDYRNKKCNLSGKTRRTITPASDYTEPCYVSGYQYAERTDKFCGY